MLQAADSLKRDYFFYHWDQKGRIYLTKYCSLERQFPRVIFQYIEFKKDSGLLILEGFVNQTGEKYDTLSRMGGLTILVAKRDNNNSLSNIRRFGTTKSILPNESSNDYPEGSFYLRLKLKQNEVLLIGEPGDLYWGAVVVPIWKLTRK